MSGGKYSLVRSASFLLKTDSHVAKTGLKLALQLRRERLSLLPPPFSCWDYRRVPHLFMLPGALASGLCAN